MICALSVYSGDAAAAQRLLEWIAELGGVGSHSLVLATTQHVNPASLLEVAQKSWGSVEQFTLNLQNEKAGWPHGPNGSFVAVANFLKDRGQPFLFLESDCTPIMGNWLDQLEREYHAKGKPFMGIVHTMYDVKTWQPIPGTMHMNGVGIYPANLDRHLPTLAFMTGALSGQPWDVALRHEVMSQVNGVGGFKLDASGERISACHATDKMCMAWKTTNYRVENDSLTYDSVAPVHHKQIDFWKHVLHHGCKDGSLIDVLRQRLNPKPKLTTVFVDQAFVPAEPDLVIPAKFGPLVLGNPEELKPRKIAKLKGRRGRPPKNIVVDSVT